MKFGKLQIENWRNFTHINIPLQQRVFLVGPNASGKSNLLDVLRFLRDLVRVGGGLEKAVADRGGISRLRSLAARSRQEIVIDVEIEDGKNILWRYRIGIVQDSSSRPHLREKKSGKPVSLSLTARTNEMNTTKNDSTRPTWSRQIQTRISEKSQIFSIQFATITLSLN